MKANKITDLILHEVSLVEEGANQGAKLALFKSKEQPKEPNMELEKQIEELTAKNLELQKSLDEAVSIEKDETPISKEEVEDPRILKALEIGEASKTEAEALRKEIDEIKSVQLTKDVTEQVSAHAGIFKSDEDQVKAVDILKGLGADAREFILDSICKTATIIEEASKTIEKELGGSGDKVSVSDRIENEAKELAKAESISVASAKGKLVSQLSKAEVDEYNKGGTE